MKSSVALTILLAGLVYAIDTSVDLIASETGYAHHYATPVHHVAPAPVAYSAGGTGAYGKHVQDYGNHAYGAQASRDHYGDAGYGHKGVKAYDDYANHGGHYGNHADEGHGYDHGVYTRNRGYGYEKHYAYDKELATKANGGAHAVHGASAGHHGQYGHHGLVGTAGYGHNRYGDHDGYANQGHGKYGHLLGSYGHQGYGHQTAPYHGYAHAVPVAHAHVAHHAVPVVHHAHAASHPVGITYY